LSIANKKSCFFMNHKRTNSFVVRQLSVHEVGIMLNSPNHLRSREGWRKRVENQITIFSNVYKSPVRDNVLFLRLNSIPRAKQWKHILCVVRNADCLKKLKTTQNLLNCMFYVVSYETCLNFSLLLSFVAYYSQAIHNTMCVRALFAALIE
jgi:hypothetical protein